MQARTTLRQVAGFCAGFLVFNALINVALGQWFEGSIASLDEAEFGRLTGELDYLVMGDSHGEDGVDPSILGDSFNYGLRGENYILTYYKLKSIVEEATVEVDTVILPFGYHSFSSFWREQVRPLSFWRRHVSFLEVAYNLGEVATPAIKLVEAMLFPYAQDIDETTGLLFPADHLAVVPFRGYTPRLDRLSDTRGWRSYGRARVDFYLGGEEPLDPGLVLYFHNTLELCREHGIRVLLVRYPVTREFHQAASEVLAEHDHAARTRELLRTYPQVRVLDFRRALFDRPYLFANHDHLNAQGAQVFTRLLKDSIEAAGEPDDR